jgi:hypothetical protein
MNKRDHCRASPFGALKPTPHRPGLAREKPPIRNPRLSTKKEPKKNDANTDGEILEGHRTNIASEANTSSL